LPISAARTVGMGAKAALGLPASLSEHAKAAAVITRHQGPRVASGKTAQGILQRLAASSRPFATEIAVERDIARITI
jgi:hypothetical protein